MCKINTLVDPVLACEGCATQREYALTGVGYYNESKAEFPLVLDKGTVNDWCSVCGRSRYTPPSTACPAGSHFGAYVRIGDANSD